MATILENLKGLNAYPIPMRTIVSAAAERGLDLEAEASTQITKSRAYKLVIADIYCWLAEAPNISQGGQSYSFSEEQRKMLRSKATALYKEFEEKNATGQATYGYKGSRL